MSHERITHAVVRTVSGCPIMGESHAQCFYKAAETGLPMSNKAIDQGFMTSNGRYVTRDEAYYIAHAANQIDHDPGHLLFSEMLWSPASGGRHSYCHIRGYLMAPRLG